MDNPFSTNRHFERLLFGGIPEHPEFTWERNYSSIVSERSTGQSHSLSSPNDDFEKDIELMWTIKFKPTNQEIEVVRILSHNEEL